MFISLVCFILHLFSLQGKSILYKWNSNTSLFETYQYIETSTVRHSNVMKNGTDTFLAIANREPQSVEVWTWKSNDSGFVRTQIISGSSPAAVEFFMIDDKAFMAISNDYDPVLQSTKALSVIHRLNRSSRKWERLQDIPTDSAHDVKYFRDSKHHYVAFTSGEIDVYRYSESSGLFSCDHSIKASSPVGMQLIHLENAMFLVAVSNREGIVVYRERLHFNYELVAAIPHTSVTHVTAFLVGNRPYLAVGSKSNMKCNEILGEHCPKILEGNVSGIYSHNFDGC